MDLVVEIRFNACVPIDELECQAVGIVVRKAKEALSSCFDVLIVDSDGNEFTDPWKKVRLRRVSVLGG